MKFRMRSGLLAAMMVAALALSAGCGDNDNDGGGNGASPTPVRTPTPVITATPSSGTTASVAFNVTASVTLSGFQFTATYPSAKGSFTGSADGVSCTTTSVGLFTKNDQDNGNLVLSVANASALTLPVSINCTFDVVTGQNLAAGDIGITNREVVNEDGGQGDPNALTVNVSVS